MQIEFLSLLLVILRYSYCLLLLWFSIILILFFCPSGMEERCWNHWYLWLAQSVSCYAIRFAHSMLRHILSPTPPSFLSLLSAALCIQSSILAVKGWNNIWCIGIFLILSIAFVLFCYSLLGMKHFKQEDIQKLLNIILLLYLALWSHVLLQLFVSVTELLRTRHCAILLMLLQIAT